MTDRDTDISPPPTQPPDDKPATIPPEAPKPATVTEWAAVEASLGNLHRLFSGVAESNRRLEEKIDNLITEVRGFNQRADKLIGISQQCFDEANIVKHQNEEIAKTVANHEHRISIIEHPQRPTMIPPSNGNGTDG